VRLNGGGESRVQIRKKSAKIQAELQMRPNGNAAQELASQIVASEQSPRKEKGVANGNAQRGSELEAECDLLEGRDADAALNSLPSLTHKFGSDAREQIVQRLSVDGECKSSGGGGDSAQYISRLPEYISCRSPAPADATQIHKTRSYSDR